MKSSKDSGFSVSRDLVVTDSATVFSIDIHSLKCVAKVQQKSEKNEAPKKNTVIFAETQQC